MCAFDAPDNETRNKLIVAFLQDNLLMAGCGEKSVRFRPHLIVTKDEIMQGMGIIREVLRKRSYVGVSVWKDPCMVRGT
jgi:L-lysine 6-transaminase